jgi:anthranilate phosphoribosyltransferase
LDEITLSGPTHVASVGGEEVSEFQIMPEDFGIDSQQIDHLAAVSPAESARFVCGVLDRSVDGAARDLVLVNAAAALFISGAADTLPDSFALARESIMSGAALEKLRQLSKETNR